MFREGELLELFFRLSWREIIFRRDVLSVEVIGGQFGGISFVIFNVNAI